MTLQRTFVGRWPRSSWQVLLLSKTSTFIVPKVFYFCFNNRSFGRLPATVAPAPLWTLKESTAPARPLSRGQCFSAAPAELRLVKLRMRPVRKNIPSSVPTSANFSPTALRSRRCGGSTSGHDNGLRERRSLAQARKLCASLSALFVSGIEPLISSHKEQKLIKDCESKPFFHLLARNPTVLEIAYK